MKKIVLSQYPKDQLNAGPKAKTDMEKIMAQYFDAHIMTLGLPNDIFSNRIKRYLFFLKKFYSVKKTVRKDDIVFIQFPFTNQPSLVSNAKYKICLIHDIDGLRSQDKVLTEKELAFFEKCDVVVAHNLAMKNYLIQNGIKEQKIFVLEMFDYLTDLKEITEKEINDKELVSLVYTGNLDKAPFLFQLDEEKMEFRLNIYGIKSKEINNSKVNYIGAFKPEELPNHIYGNLGLVWDGNLDESDEDLSFKNYTKYNNPHKLSCYLSAGLPVIVWKKSAVASFVLENNIGYVINNLYEINQLDFSDYNEKAKNAYEIGKKVRDGYYTKKAVKSILESLERK